MKNFYKVLILSDFQREICAVLNELSECNLILCPKSIHLVGDLRRELKDEYYDIVISDYIFSNSSINDLLGTMSQGSVNIQVILISEKVSQDDMFKLIEVGVNDYIEIDNLSRLKYSVFKILKDAEKNR